MTKVHVLILVEEDGKIFVAAYTDYEDALAYKIEVEECPPSPKSCVIIECEVQ